MTKRVKQRIRGADWPQPDLFRHPDCFLTTFESEEHHFIERVARRNEEVMDNSSVSIENLKRQLNLITNAFELDDNACVKGTGIFYFNNLIQCLSFT